jgi:hypothetical protein
MKVFVASDARLLAWEKERDPMELWESMAGILVISLILMIFRADELSTMLSDETGLAQCMCVKGVEVLECAHCFEVVGIMGAMCATGRNHSDCTEHKLCSRTY